MTGAEHYRWAEQLIEHGVYDEAEPEHVLRDIAEAQVHALLALAAATALGREGEGRTQPSQDKAAWFDVAAECRKAATA